MHYFDPIVFPGVYGYVVGGPAPFNTGTHGPAHWHNFFGNTSINPNGIKDPAAPTTCTGPFKGTFWVPNLLGYNATFPTQGFPMLPRTMSYYLNEPLPSGFAFIARDVTWDCGIGTTKTPAPHTCRTGTIQSVTRFRPAARLRVRTDWGVGGLEPSLAFFHLSVGGVTIAAQSADGTWHATCNDSGETRCEDELSFHMDVLAP
jgi:hypothetical protein